MSWGYKEKDEKNMEQKSVSDKTDEVSQGKDVKLIVKSS